MLSFFEPFILCLKGKQILVSKQNSTGIDRKDYNYISSFMVISMEETDPISLKEAAQGYAAIGSKPRLEVLLALVRKGPKGLSVGEIQCQLGFPASTLAHHLKFLAAAGLIEQEKSGRMVLNHAAYERIESLAKYLLRECCNEAEPIKPYVEHKAKKQIPALR